MNQSYRITRGKSDGADISTATPVIAAVTGKTLSIKQVIISTSAAENVTIEDEDGTNLLPIIYHAANTTTVLNFAPGECPVTEGKGISALSSAADVCSVFVSAYVM